MTYQKEVAPSSVWQKLLVTAEVFEDPEVNAIVLRSGLTNVLA